MLVDNNGAKKTLSDLLVVMAGLRTPGTGCPWDLEQTFATIAPYTIEEAYEVADAIAHDDIAGLKDELGDLLLQVVYHARMAQEQDAFAFDDVVDAIARKMIRRHPHVFGTAEERAAGKRAAGIDGEDRHFASLLESVRGDRIGERAFSHPGRSGQPPNRRLPCVGIELGHQPTRLGPTILHRRQRARQSTAIPRSHSRRQILVVHDGFSKSSKRASY